MYTASKFQFQRNYITFVQYKLIKYCLYYWIFKKKEHLYFENINGDNLKYFSQKREITSDNI